MATGTASIDVLLVDDSAIILMLLEDILGKAGINVLAAVETGQALRRALKRHHPQVILLDQNLPDSHGLDLLRLIKISHPNTAVIMISIDDNPELERKARKYGAVDFVCKPFVGQKIVQKVIQAAATLKSNPRRAIIADDSAAMRALLSTILTEQNVTVLAEAENGLQAYELAQKHLPDIIFLDIEMPVKTGLDALAELHAAHPAIRKVMITGQASPEYVKQSIFNGASGFIVKPFESEKILAELNRLLPK